MLQLFQSGWGPRRVLVVSYFTSNRAALLSELPASWCVVVDYDNPNGRFAHKPGIGGVDPLPYVVTWARDKAGTFEVSHVVLIGWSIGCEAVREQLREALRSDELPAAVLALDGTSGSFPPTDAQLLPWRATAARARAGECLLVLTHSLQTYTEHRGKDSYLSTLSGCRLITGWPLEEAGPVLEPVVRREGDLVVASYQSAAIDADAHKAQQTIAMPDLLRRIVVPWVESGIPAPAPTKPSPAPLLRIGSAGPGVTAWQMALTASGYPVATDGFFGPKTDAATRALQSDAHLAVDGVVGPLTRAAAEARAEQQSYRALTEAEKDALFGHLTWEPAEPPVGAVKITAGLDLVQVHVPQLHGVQGAPADATVLFNRQGALQLQELFTAWGQAGLLPLVLSYAGTYAPRRVRGGTTLSSHARGIAIDLNVQWNPPGVPPAPRGAKGSLVELLPLARAHGFWWGGAWTRPDGHHLELCRL